MNTNIRPTDCDVLIVGAGPTGLTLAAHLLARGIHTRVIDKDPGTPRLSRAIGIAPRTLETLDMMGIADRFLDEGHRVRGISLYTAGRRLLGIDMAHSGSAYQFMLHLPQHRTEALLRARVAELGGSIDSYGTERAPVAAQVLDFTQRIVRFGTQPRSLKRTLRNAALPALRLPAVQRRLAGRMSQTLVEYPDGPLTQPGRLGDLPRPGTRMRNVDVYTADGQDTLHAVLRRCRHVLLVNGEPPDGLAPYRHQIELVNVPQGRSHSCVLVRPDGYVAAVGTSNGTVLRYLHHLSTPAEPEHDKSAAAP
jgi:hypothetical protein